MSKKPHVPAAPRAPKASGSDRVHAIAKGLIGAIPAVGSPLAEVFALAFGAPLESRRVAWMESIADLINEVADRVDGITVESLTRDEAFVSMVLAITAVAVRTHQQEKLEALRNAVAHAAIGTVPDYDERAMLLHILERLTPLHLAVIRFFDEPRADETIVRRFEDTMGSLGPVMEAGVPALAGRKAIHDLIWKELVAAGLIQNSTLGGMMTGSGLLTRRTTELGRQLIEFISRPDLLDESR
jgi:hypothetical protein